MRSSTRTTLVAVACLGGVLVLALAAVVGVSVLGGGGTSRDVPSTSRFASPEHAVPSLVGGWSAVAVPGPDQNGVPTWIPVIRDAAGTEVFRDDEAYSTRHGVGITWLSGTEQLWVLSSDVGTASVDHAATGWTKTEIWPETRGRVPPEIVDLGG